jgi:hypothetical protein
LFVKIVKVVIWVKSFQARLIIGSVNHARTLVLFKKTFMTGMTGMTVRKGQKRSKRGKKGRNERNMQK